MKTTKVLKLTPVIALAMLISCTGKKQEATTTADEKVKVKIETVAKQPVEQISEFTATVEAEVKNNIAPQTMARIEKVFVEVGDQVRKGQVLAEMDNTMLKQAKLQMDNLEVEFNRIDELYKVGGVAKSAWDSQKMAYDLSKTQYHNLAENARLVSPINGIVTARNYDSGDMFSMGQPLYTVEQIRPVKLIVHVSESYFTKVKKGNEATIKLDVYGDEEFKGQVSLVYPTIDPGTRTFPVEIKINNTDMRVRPGMFARVTMSFGAIEHVVAPDLSIVKQTGSGERYIWVYSNGKVSYQNVELGRRMGNRYEVISGVNDGDQVVVHGQSRLLNGMDVEVIK